MRATLALASVSQEVLNCELKLCRHIDWAGLAVFLSALWAACKNYATIVLDWRLHLGFRLLAFGALGCVE